MESMTIDADTSEELDQQLGRRPTTKAKGKNDE